MATYVVLNMVFSLTLLLFRPRIRRPSKAWLAAAVCLVCMTAVFDSIIVGSHIVGYDAEKILGIYIGLAPVEDFFYALYAICLIPLIWDKLENNDETT